MDKKKIALIFALGAIGLGGLIVITLFLILVYSVNVWFGIFSSAILLMGITLNILSDEGNY